MDQCLHRLRHDLLDVLDRVALSIAADRQLSGPRDLLVGHHDRIAGAGTQTLDALLDDVHRLVHLAYTDQEATVGIAGGLGDNLEVVGLVAAVRLRLAEVVWQTSGTQDRAGDSEGHAAGEVEETNLDGATHPDVVVDQQVRGVLETLAQQRKCLGDLVDATLGDVLSNATGTDVRAVHAQAGDHLEDVEDELALAEAEGHGSKCTEFHATGGKCDQVRGNAVELHHHHADDIGALGDLVGDAEQLLDGQAVGGLVEERRQVVHAGDEGDALRERAELHVLLDAGVQIANAATSFGDGLALDLEDQAEHAVGRRMLRTHVDDDALLLAIRCGRDGVPVAAGDRVDLALGGLVGAGVRIGACIGTGVRDVLGRH